MESAVDLAIFAVPVPRTPVPMIDLAAIAANIEQSADGIWRCKSASPVSYPEWGNDACFQVEDVSFWFRHRNACILEVMRQVPPPGPVFDVGGGNGFVAKGMQDAGFDVVLLEPGSKGASNAQRRGIRNVICAGLEDAGLGRASMSAAGLFDVVEHIEEDREFVKLVRSYLCPGGRVYLTVPAYQSLWSHEDEDAGHFRRYGRQTLLDLLRESGFAVEFLTGFFQFLVPAILVGRVLPYRLGQRKTEGHAIAGRMRAEHEVRNVLARRTLAWLQERELKKIRRRQEMPRGASWLAAARKI